MKEPKPKSNRINFTIVVFIVISILALSVMVQSKGESAKSKANPATFDEDSETISVRRKKRQADDEDADEPPADDENVDEPPADDAKAGSTSSKSSAGSDGPDGGGDGSSVGMISDAEFESEPPQDPFSIAKWTQFKTRVKQIQEALLNLTSDLVSKQASQPKTEGEGSEANGSGGEFGTILKSLEEFFAPLDEELLDAIPYTMINPAVDLYTKPLLNTLASTKPTKLRDRTRLKWVEVNALAVTTHYAFERICRLMNQDGDRDDIKDALVIEYPSWIEEVNTNDTESFQLMNIGTIVDRIHGQFNILGDKYQLLRGLEKLLRKKLKDLNPEKTDLNLYCYGNNDFIMVYDVPDLLTDAALYLVLADMKYFVLQLLKAINAPATEGTTLTQEHDQIKQNMTERIEKKISIGEPVESEAPPKFGPTMFPCDPKPKPEANETKVCVSSPLSPDVHIIDNVPTLVEGNAPAQIDPATKHALYANGSRIPGIEVYKRFLSVDGTPIQSTPEVQLTTSEDGTKVLDGNGTQIEGATVQFLYIPYDDLPRGDEIPEFPKVEWGRFGCSKSPNASTPTTPHDTPFGPPTSPGGEPSSGGRPPATSKPPPGGKPGALKAPPGGDGYPDDRKPNYDGEVAQFGMAYTGYIEAELVLNNAHTCTGTCADYHSDHGTPTTCMLKSNERCQTYRDSMCQERGSDCLRKSQCAGKARRCVRTAPVVEICESQEAADSNRIYDWIKMSDGRVITAVDQSDLSPEGADANTKADEEASEKTVGGNGTSPSCATKVQVAKERWQMDFGIIMTAPEYCELCMCVCDEPLIPEGHHVFGLHPIIAKEGFVITAVRFEQNGNSMQLNVEQAKWTSNGHVDESTIEWQEAPEIDKLAKDGTWAKLGTNGFRKMNVDSVFVAKNEVVTGLRVVLEGESLSLQVQGTPVQADGTLGAEPSEWKGVDNSTQRHEIDLSDAESSIKQKGPSQPLYQDPDSVNGTSAAYFVRFDASSLLKDGGQSVIPFFDLQPVHHHFSYRKALQGAGISYKAKHGYGGFLVPAVSIYKKSF